LGGLAVARRWIFRRDSYLAFAYSELGVGLSITLTLPFYERLPYYFAVIAGYFARTPETFWLHQAVQLFVCFSLMLLPTFFLGMTLPLASRISARSFAGVGQSIGEVFSANTAGTILGGAVSGLVLLPYLGMKGLIELGVIVNIGVGTFVLALAANIGRIQKTIVLGVSYALFVSYLYVFPSWDKNILNRGVYRTSGLTSRISYEQFKNMRREEILYYKDGANATVTISRQKSGNISLQVNGKTDASSHGDLPTQILSAQIPLLLKPDASHVLVIGLGSGITAGSVLTYPVTKVEIVEISPEVVEGSRFF
jgi:spermidine synthase